MDVLQTRFAKFKQVNFVNNKDPKSTGNFEITVNGILVHSKQTKGHGFFHDNHDQHGVVFNAIDDAIKELDKNV